MNKTTHVTGAIFLSYILYPIEPEIGCVAAAALGGLLPDIDQPYSTIGQFFPIIAKNAKHRGFFHTVEFALLATAPLYLANMYYDISFLTKERIIYFFLGILSHLFLDMFNTAGIKLSIFTRKKRHRFPLHFSLSTTLGKFLEKTAGISFGFVAFCVYNPQTVINLLNTVIENISKFS